MIKEFKGDALAVKTGIIVHGCNCQGVMGSGIAKTVRERYPEVYRMYREQFDREGLKLGDIGFMEVEPNKWIVNANTQGSYGYGARQVSYDAIVQCFEKVSTLAQEINHRTKNPIMLDIVFPKIGAGLGGGDWNVIQACIESAVNPMFEKHLYIWE